MGRGRGRSRCARRRAADPIRRRRRPVAQFNERGADRIPTVGFSDKGTYRLLKKGTGEYVIREQGTNKIVTYGYNPVPGK